MHVTGHVGGRKLEVRVGPRQAREVLEEIVTEPAQVCPLCEGTSAQHPSHPAQDPHIIVEATEVQRKFPV